MYCTDEYSLAIFETLRFGLFSPEVPSLVYYSHISAVIVTLLLSLFVISRNKTIAAKILLAISIVFSALSIIDILLWTQIHAGLVMMLWSFWLTLFILLFGLSFYFLYTFIKKHDLRFLYKILFAVILVIIEIFSITQLNLEYFDLTYCEASEGLWVLNGVFAISFIIFIASVVFGLRETHKITKSDSRYSALLATIGIGLFLFVFSFATYMASIINAFFGNSSFEFLIEQYGYFGMTIFIGFLAYTIVRYKAFNIKLIATTVLVVSLVLLIGSQFIFVPNGIATILTAITLILAISFGFLLIQSVRQEVKHREEIEELAQRLKKANKRLRQLDQMKSEFVSIASHQLRSPLTSIRGYTSMILEGSYGTIPQKVKEVIERIAESSTYMASSIEDYLNVSRIEAGNMKYEMSDFNLKEEASRIADDKRPEALKKGLVLTFKSDMKKQGIVNADIGKTRQILHNLINNAIKYTPKGMITIFAHDNPKKKEMYVDIIDTGIGMKKDELEDVFGKFERAHNANQTNVTGTGLGLFVARKMAREMKGDVVAFSDGVGHGSTFRLIMPLQM